MPESNIITQITVRIALVCYAIVVACLLAKRRGREWRLLLRSLWTIGCVSFIAHVIAAFQFTHHWSHHDAIASTARQTQQLIGWAFGEGLYFSYLFLLIWIIDVVSWWLIPDRYESRSVWFDLGIHGYLFFIAFNGAVIFEAGVTRVGGIVTVVVFAVILLRKQLGARKVSES